MELTVEEALLKNYLFIDMRSPKEYGHSHIPFATSLPLLDDVSREIIGSIYKKEGREKAIDKGLEHVLPRVENLLIQINNATINREVILYCARGGMRSASVYKLFENNPSVHLLIGGYKSYRRFVLDDMPRQIEKRKIILFQGYTGVGKTNLLHQLKSDYDILDLESLANHRGSVFGDIGLKDQPSQKQFESDIYHGIRESGKMILVEAESSKIGKLHLPKDLHVKMLKAPIFYLEASLKSRVDLLHDEYGADLVDNIDELIRDTWKLKRQLGYKACEKLVNLLSTGEMKKAIELLLTLYYDPLYKHSIKKNTYRVENKFESDAPDILEQIGRHLDEILYS
ncbi:MAG TPA: tRNA 2-selenouridine(34) synthase MnmH [Clostridia bacterium]|nr:tRNA 2-selenouridine(34) synthase MnmH [Clostridia bacterium]